MRYNAEEILDMLSKTDLGIWSHFCDTSNEMLMDELGWPDNIGHACGASKFVLIPYDEDYVIKIPYTGALTESCSYTLANGNHIHEESQYYDFLNANDTYLHYWDYCYTEVMRYRIALNHGFARFFAKTKYIGDVNNFPIYVQQKVDSAASDEMYFSKEERDITSQSCKNSGVECFDPNWLTAVRKWYGDNEMIRFLQFIESQEWDDDLHHRNVGYMDSGKPMILDYSSFEG